MCENFYDCILLEEDLIEKFRVDPKTLKRYSVFYADVEDHKEWIQKRKLEKRPTFIYYKVFDKTKIYFKCEFLRAVGHEEITIPSPPINNQIEMIKDFKNIVKLIQTIQQSPANSPKQGKDTNQLAMGI